MSFIRVTNHETGNVMLMRVERIQAVTEGAWIGNDYHNPEGCTLVISSDAGAFGEIWVDEDIKVLCKMLLQPAGKKVVENGG